MEKAFLLKCMPFPYSKAKSLTPEVLGSHGFNIFLGQGVQNHIVHLSEESSISQAMGCSMVGVFSTFPDEVLLLCRNKFKMHWVRALTWQKDNPSPNPCTVDCMCISAQIIPQVTWLITVRTSTSGIECHGLPFLGTD